MALLRPSTKAAMVSILSILSSVFLLLFSLNPSGKSSCHPQASALNPLPLNLPAEPSILVLMTAVFLDNTSHLLAGHLLPLPHQTGKVIPCHKPEFFSPFFFSIIDTNPFLILV